MALDSGGHWYDAEGNPRHSIVGKNSKERPTTLRDAKKNNWLPSCTTVMKVMHKPELDKWKLKQVALEAMRNPFRNGESEDEFVSRITTDAFKQVEDAANLGTRIHHAIEMYFQGFHCEPEMQIYVDAVEGWVIKNGVKWIEHEVRVVNREHGYAGTTDAKALIETKGGKLATVDFKSRKTSPKYDCKPWATEPLQIAAYGKVSKTEIGVNVYISTTEPGRLEDCWYDENELAEAWETFLCVNRLWQRLNNYTPHK